MEMLKMHLGQPGERGSSNSKQLKDLRFGINFLVVFFCSLAFDFFVGLFCLFDLYLLEPMLGFWGHAGPFMFKPQGSWGFAFCCS